MLVKQYSLDVGCLIEQFVQYCYSQDQSRHTIATRKCHLGYFARFCANNTLDIASLNNFVIDQFFLEFGRSRAKSTVNASRRILKVFIRWVSDYAGVDLAVNVDAIKLAREPKLLPKAIDRETIIKAIAFAERDDAVLIELMWKAGLRIGEIVRVREKDIRLDEIKIQGKGGAERMVYVPMHLAKKLAEMKTGRADRLIFRNNTAQGGGCPLSLKAARLHIQRVFDRVGVQMTPHQLRHSFAVGMLLQGCDIITIQTLMGHEDVSTTQIYLRLSDSQVKAQYKMCMA